jgi:HrpA-like RNA helicase
MQWQLPSAERWPKSRKATYWLSCPGSPKSSGQPNGLRGCLPKSIACTAVSNPQNSAQPFVKVTNRKVILATSIAETSLTIDGVHIVIDSGLTRRARYDRAAGSTRLVTERASQAAVTQRAGRAARQGPGVAYRLVGRSRDCRHAAIRPARDIGGRSVASCCSTARCGASAIRRRCTGSTLLQKRRSTKRAYAIGRTGAIDADGRPTDHGHAIARLPLPPRLAHMLVAGSAKGVRRVRGGGRHALVRTRTWRQ